MLKRLHLRNFTVFADAEFEFGDGLNVLVGTNGTGKTHVLKAGYVVAAKLFNQLQQDADTVIKQPQVRQGLELWVFNDKLINVFQPIPFEQRRLIRFGHELAKIEAEIAWWNMQFTSSIVLDLNSMETPLPISKRREDGNTISANPVFIPAKEVLTLGWLLSLYDRREIPIDESYPDLLRLLSGPPLRQPEPAHIVEKLVQLIGGKVEEEGGHFYLVASDQKRLEMNLVAEGMRKFATLYKLLANGTLTPETTLFWDEPEANLNPALLKELAAVLTDLAQEGFQIILATHSLFLMRELHILAQQKKKSVRYFGLYASEEGDVRVERQDDLMQLQHITALDAELAQTFDFEAALDEDYAGDS